MIESLKELEKLLKLCRKQGVIEISVVGANIKLGELPTKQVVESIEEEQNPLEGFPDTELSPEELTFFANGGKPEENPYRRTIEN